MTTRELEAIIKQKKQELAKSICDLGILHFQQQDYPNAVKYFQEATTFGNMIAQHNLASCYYLALGTDKDYAKAAQLFHSSAQQGNKESEKALADVLKTMSSEAHKRHQNSLFKPQEEKSQDPIRHHRIDPTKQLSPPKALR